MPNNFKHFLNEARNIQNNPARLLYSTYWSLQSEFENWIANCGELSNSSIEQKDEEYQDLERQHQQWLVFMSRPFEDIVKGLKDAERRAEEEVQQMNAMVAGIRERAGFEKWKGTEWEELFDDGVWEGDEELVKKENARLKRLRESFIKKFGHAPEDD